MSTNLLQSARSVAPRFRTVPEAVSSAGVEAVQLLESANRPPDPWQADALHDALGELPDGKWAARQVGLVVPRQNGKGDVLLGKALHSMFLTPVKLILWSAHEFKTAREMFLRTRETIEGCDDLRRRVKTVRTSHGEEGVELLDGTRLGFVARSRGSGRGFSPEELLLDEAYALTDEQIAAQLFSVSAQPNAQIWYASSHPLALSVVLRRLMKRGRAGSPGLCYLEWSSDPALARDDPESHRQSNPGYPHRIGPSTIADELTATAPEDFDRERRGIVDLDEDARQEIDPAVWLGCQHTASKPQDPVAFALDMTPDRTVTTIGVAGYRDDGRRHGEVVEQLQGTRRVVKRLGELAKRWTCCVVVIDANSPAASLVPDLAKVGIVVDPERDQTRLELVGGHKMSAACGGWYDAVHEDQIRHLGQEPLNKALAGAKKRETGDGGWKWSRKDSSIDISPLMAVNLADYGLVLYGDPEEAADPWMDFG